MLRMNIRIWELTHATSSLHGLAVTPDDRGLVVKVNDAFRCAPFGVVVLQRDLRHEFPVRALLLVERRSEHEEKHTLLGRLAAIHATALG